MDCSPTEHAVQFSGMGRGVLPSEPLSDESKKSCTYSVSHLSVTVAITLSTLLVRVGAAAGSPSIRSAVMVAPRLGLVPSQLALRSTDYLAHAVSQRLGMRVGPLPIRYTVPHRVRCVCGGARAAPGGPNWLKLWLPLLGALLRHLLWLPAPLLEPSRASQILCWPPPLEVGTCVSAPGWPCNPAALLGGVAGFRPK